MANRLSDDELRKSLQEYGEDVGPITPTTRSLWERRLTLLRKINGPAPTNRVLNAFSSDDSEIESAVVSRARKKRTLNRNDSAERSERLSLNRQREVNSSPETEAFKKPSLVHTQIPSQEKKTLNEKTNVHRNQNIKIKMKKSPGKHTTFDVETSDSDFDTESPYISKSPRLRRRTPTSNLTSDYLGVNLRRLNADSTNCENSIRRNSLNSTWNANTENSLHRFSPVLDRLKRDHCDHGYRSNGYLSNTITNGEFHEEKIQGSSTNYSHCVSWLLVLGAVIFFVVIGTVYMSEVQKSNQTNNKNYSKYCSDLDEDNCKLLISVLRELHQLLTTVAGDYECDTTGLAKNRNLTVSEVRFILQQKFSTEDSYNEKKFDETFHFSLSLIPQNLDWGIKLYQWSDKVSPTGIQGMSNFDFSALEATQAAKSLWCRIRHSLHWTVSRFLMISAVAAVLFVAYFCVKLWKKRREAQEKLFYEMVEKVIDILQEPPDSSYQSDSNSGPYKAVVNIRDTLISPKERKEKIWLWDKVVAFIEENESRVSVEYKTIAGEDFKVWRWHPNTSVENEGGKQGKVWQGQAFNSLGKGKTTAYSPTPCLKIRNMFDSEVEYGDDWQVSIQDAILEKCEGIDGIRHIAVDTSSPEGCLYMLCSSTEAAGKAYNALHGWWFDGKLVTVKYLRYERYLERFPGAVNCVEPLKPSNNKRLSLSTPFFSSALERS